LARANLIADFEAIAVADNDRLRTMALVTQSFLETL